MTKEAERLEGTAVQFGGEGRGGRGARPHIGGNISDTTFDSATPEEIPRSYCPFGKNCSGTGCLPRILERVWNTVSNEKRAKRQCSSEFDVELPLDEQPGGDPGHAADCLVTSCTRDLELA